MKRRNVTPKKEKGIVKRKVTPYGKILLRALAVLLVTAFCCLFALWIFCYAVFCGPSVTARDEFTLYLQKNAVTKEIPYLFLSDETVKEIIEGGETQ